jgi:hypothetical protein
MNGGQHVMASKQRMVIDLFDGFPAPPEPRKSRVELVWPSALKAKLTAHSRANRLSVNEMIIRLVEIYLRHAPDPTTEQAQQQPATQP